LQDKALRAVWSVGVDMVIVDSARSMQMGKLELEQKEILDVKDTEQLFGKFVVPKKPLVT
jgi:hypothetical protein